MDTARSWVMGLSHVASSTGDYRLLSALTSSHFGGCPQRRPIPLHFSSSLFPVSLGQFPHCVHQCISFHRPGEAGTPRSHLCQGP